MIITGKLRPIVDDNEADVALWNKEIAKYFRGKDFMNAPWLFAEAYKYRRLHECFSTSKYWKDYDVFFRQKVSLTATCDSPEAFFLRGATLRSSGLADHFMSTFVNTVRHLLPI